MAGLYHVGKREVHQPGPRTRRSSDPQLMRAAQVKLLVVLLVVLLVFALSC